MKGQYSAITAKNGNINKIKLKHDLAKGNEATSSVS
jgi:hypothetical protein